MRLKKLNIKGFTLIELMLVLVIMGVVSAIAIPYTLNTAHASKRKLDRQSAVMIKNAVEMAYIDGAVAKDSVINVPTTNGDPIEAYIVNSRVTAPQSVVGSHFEVKVISENEYEVYLVPPSGSKIPLYPNPAEDYK